MSEFRASIKPGRASLIGGVAVAVATSVLWTAVAHELGAATPVWLVLGVLVAGGIGTWIRMADL
jgi:hypothetical protein